MNVQDATGAVGGVKERTGCLSDDTASWATHAATLSPDYAKRAAREESAVSVRKRWRGHSGLYTRNTEDCQFAIVQQPGGWLVQRSFWNSAGSNSQILCNILGDMPILCPRFVAAAQLAEACHPTPLAVLQWRTDAPASTSYSVSTSPAIEP